MSRSILSEALQADVDNTPALTATFKLNGHLFKVGSRPLTANDFAAVNKTLPVNLQSDPTQFEGQVSMLIRKTHLLDDEGGLSADKAFSPADKPNLMRLRVEAVSEMFRDLYGSQISDDVYNEAGDKVDEAKGN